MDEPLSTVTAPPSPPSARARRFRLGSALGIALGVAYPVLVYLGLTHLRARAVALTMLVAALGVAAWRVRRQQVRSLLVVPIAMCALLAAGAVLDDARLVLAMPVLVNAVLLAAFGASLRAPVPMVERFARLQKPELSAAEVRYCRSVTIVWCVFFVANGAVAGALALRAPLSWWTLWTGALSYVAMGTLFAAEWLVRRARFGAS